MSETPRTDSSAALDEAAIRADERERIAWLLTRKRAVYCKACDGAPCGYEDELAPAADLIRAEAAGAPYRPGGYPSPVAYGEVPGG